MVLSEALLLRTQVLDHNSHTSNHLQHLEWQTLDLNETEGTSIVVRSRQQEWTMVEKQPPGV